MPEDDVENFSERLDERRQLFEDICNRHTTTQLSPLVWALCQVGDLEELRKLSHSAQSWMIVYRIALRSGLVAGR